MSSSPSNPDEPGELYAAPHILKLWTPDTAASQAGDRLSPQTSLAEFFERWFVPVVLTGERNTAAATLGSYRESVAYWVRTTGDPPLAKIDEYTIAKFQEGLRAATYKRGPYGAEKPLAAYTIAKHLKQIRAVLHRTGPTVDQARPAKGLLAASPHVRVSQPRSKVKPRFSIDHARRIVAATSALEWPRKRGERPAPTTPAADWWKALILTLYYTGLRIGTVLQLERNMVEERDGATWLNVPGAIVNKTHKGQDKFLHPLALKALNRLETAGLLLPWPWGYEVLARHNNNLQAQAGIPTARRLSPHAWRRTHGSEMARAGSMLGIHTAQASLDHADAKTTSSFYVDLEPEMIGRLPAIDLTVDHRDDAQKRLF